MQTAEESDASAVSSGSGLPGWFWQVLAKRVFRDKRVSAVCREPGKFVANAGVVLQHFA